MLKEAEDQRAKFAQDLVELSHKILADPRQPAAFFVHLHYEDQRIFTWFRERPGFNILLAIAGFECTKVQMISAVYQGESK